jgi:hypothetical protein
MFGRTVKIGDKEYFVGCLTDTPHSEILARAATMAKADEAVAAFTGILSGALNLNYEFEGAMT